MFGKVKRVCGFFRCGTGAQLALCMLLAGVTCLGCDLDGRDIIRELADYVEDSGEDTSEGMPTDPTGEDTGGAESGDTEGGADPGGSSDGDTGEADSEVDTGGAEPESTDVDTEPNCECVCVCDTGASPEETTDSGADTDMDTAGDTADADDTSVSSDSSDDTDMDTQDACLIISEYIEGSGRNKGVELFNCGDTAIDLTPYALCLYSNDNTECGTTLALTGAVGAGAVVTVCHTSADAIPVCDFLSGVANFSGDDRLALMKDGAVVDAFGELLVRPEGTPFADITLRRCHFAPYNGSGPFDLAAYYTTHDADDFTDFGVPPLATTCP